MDLATVMNELCTQLRVTPLPPDECGAYGLRFGATTVNLRPLQHEALLLQAGLGVADLGDPQLLQSLLADNLLPARGSAAALGLDAQGQVQLIERIELGRSDTRAVLACLTRFVKRSIDWQARLAAPRA